MLPPTQRQCSKPPLQGRSGASRLIPNLPTHLNSVNNGHRRRPVAAKDSQLGQSYARCWANCRPRRTKRLGHNSRGRCIALLALHWGWHRQHLGSVPGDVAHNDGPYGLHSACVPSAGKSSILRVGCTLSEGALDDAAAQRRSATSMTYCNYSCGSDCVVPRQVGLAWCGSRNVSRRDPPNKRNCPPTYSAGHAMQHILLRSARRQTYLHVARLHKFRPPFGRGC